MNKHLGDFLWALTLAAAGLFLFADKTHAWFISATTLHPLIMGFFKFALLASMGEMLAVRIITSEWKFFSIKMPVKMFVWGFLGVLVTIAFPIFSAGVDALIKLKMLPFGEKFVLAAFYKSVFLNIMFGFQFMTFHRITDTLIERNALFGRWPFMQIWNSIDWKNMFSVVGVSLLWFWIPAQTVTFCLPPVYRIITAAGLSIILGIILASAKLKAFRTPN